MLAQTIERTVQQFGDRMCDQEGSAEGFAQALDAAYGIDGASDDREIQALRHAEISEENLAAMQSDTGPQRPPSVIVRKLILI